MQINEFESEFEFEGGLPDGATLASNLLPFKPQNDNVI